MSKMNRYEGLFILNTSGKEEGVQDILSHVETEIKGVGGTVESIQKMDRRQFVRVSHKMSSGYYANVIFHAPTDAVSRLRAKFRLDETVFRVMFLRQDAPKAKPKKAEAKSHGKLQ